jgi:hypothetical protein
MTPCGISANASATYDNVGPISPASIEGYKQFISFRDTRSNYIFNFPVKHYDEDTFL